MSLFYLLLAILFEVAGTVSMKLSNGFTKVTPSILLVLFYMSAVYFLTLALKKLEIGMIYTVWSGTGTALLAIIGVLYFQESLNWIKVASISFIIIGVVGLNLGGTAH